MDLAEMKVSNTNVVNVNDSLKAPLLKLSIKNNSSTTIPTTNDLIIYVDKSSEETSERKTYLFTLTTPLQYASETTDEFIIEPVLDGNKIIMKTYVKRYVSESTVLVEPTLEELETQAIILFEGINYISTNYTGVDINIVYPKNNDLALYFLNNAIYSHNTKDKILSLDDIYFKDCFTEVDAGINAEFNKVTIKCMDSTNGNFSLDCDGNLVVNTVTERTPQSSSNATIDFNSIYPVGSIYLSVSSTNPSTLFGGTWEAISGRFLIGCGSNGVDFYSVAGDTGGEANHTLSIDEMPSHGHQQNSIYSGSSQGEPNFVMNYQYTPLTPIVVSSVANTGGSKYHNNMPPYLSVYIWKRTT